MKYRLRFKIQLVNITYYYSKYGKQIVSEDHYYLMREKINKSGGMDGVGAGREGTRAGIKDYLQDRDMILKSSFNRGETIEGPTET